MLKSMVELDFKNITVIHPKEKKRTDYTAALECGERIIGIRSQGDTKELIDEGYKLLKEYSNKYYNDKNNKWREFPRHFI